MSILKTLLEKATRFRHIYHFKGKVYVKYKGSPVSVTELRRRIEQNNAHNINAVNISYNTHTKNGNIPSQLYSVWLFGEYCKVLGKLS